MKATERRNKMEQTIKDYDENDVNAVRKIGAVQMVAEGTSPEEAATVSDEKASEVQQQKAVQDGKCSPEDAIENLIDRKTAQFCTWFENNAPVLVEKGCECVGGIIGSFLGNPEKGKEIGRVLGKRFAPFVKAGAKLITQCCKGYIDRIKNVAMGGIKIFQRVVKLAFA